MSTLKLTIPSRTIEIEVEALHAISVAFLGTRAIVFLILFLSSIVIPMRPGNYLYATPDNLVVDGLIRDDSWWYHNIVTRGYNMGNLQTGEQGNVAFFPLYPILVKVTAAVTGNVFLAGILVSNIAFFFALCYLYALARREFDTDTARRAIFYFAAAPTAVFFSAMYTESLFMLAVIVTFYYAKRGLWGWAGIAGFFAATTRNTGVLLTAVIALEAFHQAGGRWWPRTLTRATLVTHSVQQFKIAISAWRGILSACLVPLGLLAYMTYLTNKFGDPLGFITVQRTWGREVSGAGFSKLAENTFTRLNIGSNLWAGQLNPETLLNLLFTVIFGTLILAVIFKLRPAHIVYCAVTFVVPLSTGTVGSMTRYILMLFPCFLLLASWGKKTWVDQLVLAISLPLLAYFVIIFSHWYFAG